jgi:hypothetical protein
MGELIPFPKPKITMNKEESEEYDKIIELLKKASTFRELRHLKKRINAFKERVDQRQKQD